jgi:hypothetical protein
VAKTFWRNEKELTTYVSTTHCEWMLCPALPGIYLIYSTFQVLGLLYLSVIDYHYVDRFITVIPIFTLVLKVWIEFGTFLLVRCQISEEEECSLLGYYDVWLL